MQYRKAKMQRRITGWRLLSAATLAARYNLGDPGYAEKLTYVKALLPSAVSVGRQRSHRCDRARRVFCSPRGAEGRRGCAYTFARHEGSCRRQTLLDALGAQQVFTPPRMVDHVAHVCNVIVGGATFPVVDLQELVKGAMVPRGVNAILVLNSDLRLLRRIEYTTERPLSCRDSRLYVWGDLTIEGVSGEGNEITLGAQGEIAKLTHVEANDVPAPTVGLEPPR